MAEGRGTLTAKGHRYQQIYDNGDSSDSSSCLTRKSYSPFSKTPVRNIMSPNENLLSSSHHEIREEELQPEDDVHVPAPALRSGIVRLEENEEYPIKRHCFRDCTKKIFRNRKKSAIVPFVLAFVFMVIFIVCILRITEMYWYYHFGNGDSNAKELFIPAGSVVDVNLTSLNINAKHINKLKVTVPNKSSLVRVTTAQEEHQISLPLNTNITLSFKTPVYAITRYWKSHEHITGDIRFSSHGTPKDLYICYKWGNITNPPYCDFCNGSCNINTAFDISACFDDYDRGNDKHIIYIQFGLFGEDATIVINITETYAIPNKTSYKSIHNDDTDNQNLAVLQFPSLLSELQHPSKLYVNTHYKNTNDDCSEMIKLRIQPDSSKNAIEIIETVALVITAILSLLLSLMMFRIGIRCCCCHIKTSFCALGLFYEEPEKQVRQALCQSDGSYNLIAEETPEDFLQNSWSPEGTPVSCITAPNENNEEENAIQLDDEHVPAPAARCNIARLEENEEYPIKRYCFRECTKKIFKNKKRCAIVPFVLAFIFMVIFIVCILRITEMYWYYHFGDGENNTKELFIPVGSVVDVNLTSLNISAKHANKLKVTVPDKSSPVRVTTAREDHQISFPLNINFILNFEKSCTAIIRYWKSHKHISGDIILTLDYQTPGVHICYQWGSITNPPSYGTCCDDCIHIDNTNTLNISNYFNDDDRGNDKHIIYIQFCLDMLRREFDQATIFINITETYAIPNKTSYKSIYNDDTDNQNSAVLQFQSLLLGPSKPLLYVNTHYRNTNDDCSEMIKLEIQPDVEIIETVALVITAILSLLLSLMMFGIGIRCCCCHIKTGFCALGLFYEEQ